MITTAEVSNITRARAHELVARAERTTGSRMAAYEQVAQTVGASAGWLRKFIKGYEAKEPGATIYENIRASYENFCSRVEQENEKDEQRLQALRRGPHARTQGDSKEDRS